MSVSLDQSRSQVLHSAAELAEREGGEELEAFLRRYYRHVATEDLLERTPEDLLGAALSHKRMAAHRPSGSVNVVVSNPTRDKSGWSCDGTLVEIATDDMPFLVDSVTAEVARQGRTVNLLIHPQLVVRRDGKGDLQQVLDVDTAVSVDRNGSGSTEESWMHLEIDRAGETEADERLVAGLRRVLADVRASVEDWGRMRSACEQVVADLSKNPPSSVPDPVIERTRGLLRWLADDHFTFLGYREYALDTEDGEDVLRPVLGSGLGILRADPDDATSFSRLTPQARATARDPQLLTITKANSRATVHRSTYLDYVGVRTFDDEGNVVGEKRFLGLFTSSAYTESVRDVPVIRERVAKVLDRAGFSADSHSGKDLLEVLETYPRDELFQTSSEDLLDIATSVLHLQERRKAKLFLRRDVFGRFVVALMFIPRDRYNTAVRLRMEGILRDAFHATSVDYTTRVSESALARLHFVVRVGPGEQIPDVDEAELQSRLIDATRTWAERLEESARGTHGDEKAALICSRYARSFPEAYKEDFTPRQGVADLAHVASLQDEDDTSLTLYRDPNGDPRERRFKLFRRKRLFLTDVLPVFTHLGVGVTDERPYEVTRPDAPVWIYDFGLRAPDESLWGGEDMAAFRERFQDVFAAVWDGRAESDGFNGLVLRAGLTWRQVVVLRAVAKYLRQIGQTFSQEYVEAALLSNPRLSARLVELFETRFDPAHKAGADMEARDAAQHAIQEAIEADLESVSSLDHDRIIRAFLGVITATLRTNFFQADDNGQHKGYISFKLDCHAVPGLPEPRPMFEIWVYSPQVEGVHLRFGKVARGGLRWSDRREDFRTEVLGLVKAQMVKNAVIVPTGSKGGFFAKQLPEPAADRDAWLAEGVSAYKVFISAMLDVTDNLVAGSVVPPQDVVRHDEDDTYLVVAADKGTASFSDIANGVAQSYGYWLDDAFASGGSAGYDHKAMGITARGAWESVKRHFRELGTDTQSEDFTAVGIGDMSGDVFGNGMLLSEHIRLVAAFDHRHVFVDPDPDAASSYAERRRLFDLPRSSWADYDTSLISEGGGIWPRTAKSVPVTAQMREALGLADDVTSMTPAELIKSVLLAPVDLLWNGGIGTYVKSSTQSNADIGDRANDAIRVNGDELRVKVVGEGGNLGASQLGRIEAARHGVRINTDAIDNSAGVDTSDHEVNIKILLTGLTRDGELTLDQRNELLHSMTDEVARQVLEDNYEQNVLLGNGRAQAHPMLPVHKRLIHWLEERGELDRQLEFLPSDAQIRQRDEAGEGLTSPEFSVLIAYAKLALKNDLGSSELPEEPWFQQTLTDYFPEPIRERYLEQLSDHPLHREIIINSVVNSMVNRGGITFAFRATEETGASPEQISRAFVVCREVFGLQDYVKQVEALDNVVSTATQTRLYLEFRRLMDRSVRWFLHNRPSVLDVAGEVERFGPMVRELSPKLPELLQGAERDRMRRNADKLVELGAPEELAVQTATLLDSFSLLDIIEIAADLEGGRSAADVAPVYFHTSEHFTIDRMLSRVSGLPRDDRWDALARGALRDDLYAVLEALTRSVLDAGPEDATPEDLLELWSEANGDALGRARTSLSGIDRLDEPGISAISVALRTLRGLVRSGALTG
ncbi:MAG TPA: NAD-glutamate dehydrogenase [Segeticoccus sp.]|uniref:NAD-glutamate dehydrogenase n=1 Tax=Segeticoccus sp. TaxID=2706531 RepID=UPI002D7FAB38|nr:NAD-glutamate dehydrogenase [Segeticoccus sp.]HET8601661.1 NAD-glutamate dehydrogenase [Segeticoccus sp.]